MHKPTTLKALGAEHEACIHITNDYSLFHDALVVLRTAPWCVPWLRKDVANTSRTDEVEMQPTRTYGTPGENATSVNEYEALSTGMPNS